MKQIITRNSKSLILITICGLVLFLISVPGFAQDKTIDSLEILLQQKQKEPKRIQTLLATAKYYVYRHQEKSDSCAKQALVLSKRIKDKKSITKSYNAIGLIHLNKREYKKAFKYFQRALKLVDDERYKVDIYNNLGSIHYSQGRHKEALEYYDKVLDIYKSLISRKGIAKIYNNIGLIYDDQSQYKKALNYYFKALKQFEKRKNYYGVMATCNNIGNIYTKQGRYNKALEYQLKVLKIAQEKDFQTAVGFAFNNIGNIYAATEKHKEALGFFLKSLKNQEKLENENGIADACINIGRVFSDQNRDEQALRYYERALRIKKKLNIKRSLANLYNNIAIIYRKQLKYDKATKFYYKVLKLDQELNDSRGGAITKINLGGIYEKQKFFQKALDSYSNALKSFKQLKDKKNLAYTYNSISSVYIRQQQNSEAERTLKEAQKLAKEVRALEVLMDNYFYFHQLDSARNKYQNALNWHKQFVILKDSIFNKEKARQITEMQTRYETQKKEQENELLRKDKVLKESQIQAQEATIERQNILTTGIILGTLFLSFFALVFYRQRKHIRQLYNDIRHTIGNHLILLMNMLENQKIKMQQQTNDPLMLEALEATHQVIASISLVYGEQVKTNAVHGKHTIKIAPYLVMITQSLVKTTQYSDYPVKLELDLFPDCELTISRAVNLSMFTNEVIINALKHAFKGHTSPQINIELKQISNGKYQYIIEDNGVGFSPKLNIHNLTSQGLKQINELGLSLKGKLTIDNNSKGVKYNLIF